MKLQPIFDIPEICHRMGIRHAVISPGSRNAALTIAFARHSEINCFSVPDERSAAFIGLGMSLQSQVPTVLICTSGSAALNYAPAVAEAYFNRVPLLLLTADRPEPLINIRDGQTIFQKNLFGKHAKAYFDFPSIDGDLKSQHKVIVEAISKSLQAPFGPIQINIPFEEPFYPDTKTNIQYSKSIPDLKPVESSPFTVQVPKEIEEYSTILVVVGQNEQDENLIHLLGELSKDLNIPVVGDVIANLQHNVIAIKHHDLFLGHEIDEELKPDLVITIGLSILSKKLKNLIRNSDKSTHWHISEGNDSADTFGKLKGSFSGDPKSFIRQLLVKNFKQSKSQKPYFQKWQDAELSAKSILNEFDSPTFTDLTAYRKVLGSLPANIDLHLANSMAVRYANLIGVSGQVSKVYCNRGTSGIDGSNSTAVGSAIVAQRSTVLLTGDVAFLYDRNGFWHNHVPSHLKIIIFNNAGGGIFRLIKGPSQHKELEKFFETKQKSNASHVAEEFQFDYLSAKNKQELSIMLTRLWDSEQKTILEIFTDKEENQKVYKQLLEKVK